jgi:PAS domain S-box-containing protein
MVTTPVVETLQADAVLRAVAQAILATDRTGVITLANAAAERLFSLPTDQMIGQPVRNLNPSLGHWLARALNEKHTMPMLFELEIGDGYHYFANLAPIPGKGRQRVGWVIALQDVTPLKKLEEWKSDAIQTAAHDLRDPLNLITGAANFLRDTLEETTQEQEECFTMIRSGADRMSTLIEQLLDLQHAESGVEVATSRLNLSPVVEQVAEDFRRAAQGKGVRLEFEGGPTTAQVEGDESWLQRAVANLVSNAVKYTPSGGRVRVRYSEAEGQAVVEVMDTGPGIPQSAQARLFQRFYRVAGESTRQTPGSGLGLAIVKTIIERHGGRVWVSSVEGKGSTFGFLVPLVKS